MAFCPKCGTISLLIDNTSMCEICGFTVSLPQDVEKNDSSLQKIPWENIQILGMPRAFFYTVRQCLFKPSLFFSLLKNEDNIFNAWLFGLLANTIGVLFDLLWHINAFNPLVFTDTASIDNTSINAFRLIYSPLILSVYLIILAGYCHTLLLLINKTTKRYKSTFIVLCYVQSAVVFNIVPFLGTFIAPIWGFYILIQGMSRIHSISILRTSMTLLFPLFVFLFLVLVILTITVGSGMLLQPFLKEVFQIFR